MMEIYHVIMGSWDAEGLILFPDNYKNILVSGSTLRRDNRFIKNLDLIKRKTRSLFADSGMLGFIKMRKHNAWKIAKDPEKALEMLMPTDPDIVAHLDIPVEKHILEMLGKSREDAIKQTILNAKYLVDLHENTDYLKGKKVAIVIQGWNLDDYYYCLDSYRESGYDELDPDKYLFAIGSVCMRRPPALYEIARYIRKAVPEKYDIHCFGIANLPWMITLSEMGITSCDSATASVSASFFRILDKDAQRNYLKIEKKNKFMNSALFAWNSESIEIHMQNHGQLELDDINQMELFKGSGKKRIKEPWEELPMI